MAQLYFSERSPIFFIFLPHVFRSKAVVTPSVSVDAFNLVQNPPLNFDASVGH